MVHSEETPQLGDDESWTFTSHEVTGFDATWELQPGKNPGNQGFPGKVNSRDRPFPHIAHNEARVIE